MAEFASKLRRKEMFLRGTVIATLAATALLISAQTTTGHADESHCVDMTIVLAIDGSGSVNTEEFFLQQQAIVAALRSPEVRQAMSRAGSVLAAALYWGDAEWPSQETPFILIEDAEDIDRLVVEIEKMPRRVMGSTGLSMGISASLDKIGSVRCSHRSIINVSGDGSDTVMHRRKRHVPSMKEIRARAESEGVVINALILTGDEPNLKSYFESQVITGPDAFVMEVTQLSNYEEAMRKKLVREISPAALSRR